MGWTDEVGLPDNTEGISTGTKDWAVNLFPEFICALTLLCQFLICLVQPFPFLLMWLSQIWLHDRRHDIPRDVSSNFWVEDSVVMCKNGLRGYEGFEKWLLESEIRKRKYSKRAKSANSEWYGPGGRKPQMDVTIWVFWMCKCCRCPIRYLGFCP